MFGFGKKKKFEPIIIENAYGKFTMERDLNDHSKPSYAYSGFVDWCDPDHKVLMEVYCENEENLSADKNFARLSEILANAGEWDRKLKKYALETALELWGVENGLIKMYDEPITQEEFLKFFDLSSIFVDEDGGLEFSYPHDKDFELYIQVDSDGNFTDFQVEGL